MLSDLDMLQNLRTLSTLQINQKLCTSGQMFSVRPAAGTLTTLWRTWYGEDRQANVARLQTLFALAMLRCEVLTLKGTDDALCRRIAEQTRLALPGLECLAQTYREDSATVSSIEVLQSSVEAFLEQSAIKKTNSR